MKLLTTQDNKYLLWVDPEAEVKEGDFYKYNYPQYVTVFRANEGIKNALQKELVKIIAHLPLTPDAVPLDGVPLLPSLPKAEEQNPVVDAIHWFIQTVVRDPHGSYTKDYIKYRLGKYKTASREQKYSEEDIRRAVEKGVEIGFNNTQCNYHTIGEPTLHHIGVHNGIEEYIQSLSPAASLPVAFEPEVKCTYAECGRTECDCGAGTIKTITLPNGQQQLVGRYKYKEDNHA